ncbi:MULTISPECIES: DUF6492 family protein [unclassified Ruegeria]|uniref:DUF6492 family protein n=1 Tax=unclassified Ruegeria TaxID=2625375 RepID=UPI001489DCA5|nr:MULTISPECIES: DUF6492 family protein [unclassified Ruegeria]
MTTNTSDIQFLTCSFRGDLELCEVMCESTDRQAPEIRHLVAVPHRDVAMFRHLNNNRREVVASEELLPSGLLTLPIPRGRWRKWLGLSNHDQFLLPDGKMTNGWIVQQVLKLSASASSSAEIVVHLDSDAALIKQFSRSHVASDDGAVRLFANPHLGEREPQGSWHLAASQLLDLPPTRYFGAGYIDQVVVWRKDRVRELVKHIEEVAGQSWQNLLMRTPQFSEYILYGVFCEHILGKASGHYPTDESLSLTCWTAGENNETMLERIKPHHIGMAIQSTIPISIKDRRNLVEQTSMLSKRYA